MFRKAMVCQTILEDGYIEDEPFLASVLWKGANVKRLDEGVKQVDNGFAFPQSEESVDFSDPYTAFDVVMVVKNTDVQKNSRTLADFENANLGVVTGSIYDAHSKAIFPDAKIAYYQTKEKQFLFRKYRKMIQEYSHTRYAYHKPGSPDCNAIP